MKVAGRVLMKFDRVKWMRHAVNLYYTNMETTE